jgi:hypothetical protein
VARIMLDLYFASDRWALRVEDFVMVCNVLNVHFTFVEYQCCRLYRKSLAKVFGILLTHEPPSSSKQ